MLKMQQRTMGKCVRLITTDDNRYVWQTTSDYVTLPCHNQCLWWLPRLHRPDSLSVSYRTFGIFLMFPVVLIARRLTSLRPVTTIVSLLLDRIRTQILRYAKTKPSGVIKIVIIIMFSTMLALLGTLAAPCSTGMGMS